MQSTNRIEQLNLHVAFFMFVKKCTASTIEAKANWPKMLHSPAPQTINNALGNIVTTHTSFGSQD
jgi:hypothetical protein